MSQEIATRRVSEVIRVSASLAYASGYDWCQSGAVQLNKAIDPVNPIHLADKRVDNLRQPLSILDILLATLIVAVHLFHFPLAVRYRASSMMFLVPLIPTLIAIWIHIRARLSLLQATPMHYAISVSWAFLYGYGYALAATQEAGSAYYEDPMSMAVFLAREMAMIALFTTILYGLVALCIKLAKQLRSSEFPRR